MQGFAEKKKEEHKHEEKKQPMACKPIALSMSEGPMLSEARKIEAAGRASFEKSVKIEIAAINMRRKKKAPEKGKGKKRKGDGKPPWK